MILVFAILLPVTLVAFILSYHSFMAWAITEFSLGSPLHDQNEGMARAAIVLNILACPAALGLMCYPRMKFNITEPVYKEMKLEYPPLVKKLIPVFNGLDKWLYIGKFTLAYGYSSLYTTAFRVCYAAFAIVTMAITAFIMPQLFDLMEYSKLLEYEVVALSVIFAVYQAWHFHAKKQGAKV